MLRKGAHFGADSHMAPRPGGAALKADEDALDAVICACIAVRVLQARAEPYSDEDSAIWIPTP